MALTVNNIALGYRKNDQTNVILQDVSFDVPEKSLTCILGPSGIGKSSLLRIIAGLDKPLAGKITLFDKSITEPQPEVSFVFQSANLLPWLNVQQKVAFGLDFTCHKRSNKAEIS